MTERDSSLTVVCSAADDGGVYAVTPDPGRGTLETAAHARIQNASFLAVHPDETALYVVSRADGGRVWTVRVDRETGELRASNDRPTTHDSPCYVSVDATGRYAFVVTYGGGTVAAYPIESDGRLGEACDVVAHEGSGADPERQEAPHPHSVVPGPENRFVYVPDLGLDRIVRYRLDPEHGRLRPTDGGVDLHPEAGPRHLAFHPNGRYAYVTNELDSTVTAFERDPDTGALGELETVPTLPADADAADNAPADVHVHPSGRWVYASNRGHDSVAIYGVDAATGRLRPIGHEPTGGRTPRDIALEPGGERLFAANQHDRLVSVFAVGRDGGELEPIDRFEAAKPVCVGFLER